MSEPDLSLTETTQLIRELFKRHDHAIFIGMQDVSGGSIPVKSAIRRSWKGRHHVCAGLCEHQAIIILSDFERDMTKGV
jgi:hypothetical protein